FKLKDRHGRELALGSTHEEVITDLVRSRVSSYKDLPLALYQIQSKFRNEMRPTGGLLRAREFFMKDLYSFHESEEDLKNFYEKVKRAYLKIFKRCGLSALAIEADPGTIGGSLSHEFAVLADSGEDRVLMCQKCGYAANIEKIGDIKNCPNCKGIFIAKPCIESGHTFYLGLKYSQPMKADFVDKKGESKLIVMGCYGIGLQRLMATIVEVNYDERGIIWPESVAPFDVHLLTIFSQNDRINNQIKKAGDKLYKEIEGIGREVLYDDRKKSAGEKFAEVDLIGIPIRLVISEKTLVKNCIEVKKRKDAKISMVKLNKIQSIIK
ncbi:MAG: aminoacyl--tRNA ligase-related protein, partial [bacterium]|nr:aminoacyl--tRNA ligase-related protein [bacterium]